MHLNKTLLFAIFATSIIFVSCKKNYTCDCTVTIEIPIFGTTTTSSSTSIKDTKKNAKSACTDAENQLKAEVGNDGTASCELK